MCFYTLIIEKKEIDKKDDIAEVDFINCLMEKAPHYCGAFL
jgi:hypothetical protein